MPRLPPIAFVRDLQARVGEGPGVQLMLASAFDDFEEAQTLDQQEILWSWWILVLAEYRKRPTIETALRIVDGELDPS